MGRSGGWLGDPGGWLCIGNVDPEVHLYGKVNRSNHTDPSN
jgi:hypothetical protein